MSVGHVNRLHTMRSNSDTDEYYTPRETWQKVMPYLPKDKTAWEAF